MSFNVFIVDVSGPLSYLFGNCVRQIANKSCPCFGPAKQEFLKNPASISFVFDFQSLEAQRNAGIVSSAKTNT